MSDAQFGMLVSAIVAAGGAIGVAIRWSVSRIVKSWDDNTQATKDGFDKQLKLATELAIFSTKVDAVSSWVVSASMVLERWTVPSVPPKRLPTPTPEEQEDDYQPKKKGGTPVRGVPIIEPPMVGGGYMQKKPKKE